MRQKNDEEKEVRFERIHTWDLLHEVDELVKHLPNWRPFDWDLNVKRLYMEGYKNQFGVVRIPHNKKKKS